jgi:hypothetical protein
MDLIPDFSAWTPQDWSTFGTLSTTLIAFAAAIFAGRQVLEARRTREAQAQPFVIVDIQSSPVWANILNLVVENIGTTLATDVKISFAPPIQSSQEGLNLANSVMVAEGIPALPPGRRIEAWFDMSHSRLEKGLPLRYEASVKCKDARGRPVDTLTYTIDLNYLYGLERIDEYGMHHAADALRDIAKALKQTTGEGRLRIWVRDEDARNRDARIEYALTGRRPSAARRRPSELAMSVASKPLVLSILTMIRDWRKRE